MEQVRHAIVGNGTGEGLGMRFGELFANVMGLLLLAGLVSSTLFLLGEPLRPRHYATMVLLPMVDPVATASTRPGCDPAPCLPETLDARAIPSRPAY